MPRTVVRAAGPEEEEPVHLTVTGSGVLEIGEDGTLRSRDLMTVSSVGKFGLRVVLGPATPLHGLLDSHGTKEVVREPPEPPMRYSVSSEPFCLKVDRFGTSNAALVVDGVDVTSLVREHLDKHGVCVTCREYRPSSLPALVSLSVGDRARVAVSRRVLRPHCRIQGQKSSVLTLRDGSDAPSTGSTSLSVRLLDDAVLETDGECAFQDLNLVLHDRARCRGLVYLNSVDYELYEASHLSVGAPRDAGASRGIKREGAAFRLTEWSRERTQPTEAAAEGSAAKKCVPVATPSEKKRAPPAASSRLPKAKAARLPSSSVRFSLDGQRNGKVSE